MATDPSTSPAASPGEKLFAKAVRLDLSGSELALRGPESDFSSTAAAVQRSIEIDSLELHARPVRYLNAPLQFELSAQSVRIAPGIPSGPAPFSIHWNDGRLMIEISPAHIESLLLQLFNAALVPHETTISHVAVQFQSAGRRELDFTLECRGKRGWVAATLAGTGRVAIDEQLSSRLTRLKLEGRGVVGSLVAAILRRRLDDIEDRPIALGRPLWGLVQFTDVAFELDERVRIIGQFGPPDSAGGIQPRADGSTLLAGDTTDAFAIPSDVPADGQAERYDLYLIDTGCNPDARAALDSILPELATIPILGPVLELSRDQSLQIVKGNPHLAWTDPIVLLLPRGESTVPGFRLSLGIAEGNPLPTFRRLVALLDQHQISVAADVVTREIALGNLPGVSEVRQAGRSP